MTLVTVSVSLSPYVQRYKQSLAQDEHKAVKDERTLEEIEELRKTKAAAVKRDFEEGKVSTAEGAQSAKEEVHGLDRSTLGQFKDKFENLSDTLQQNMAEKMQAGATKDELEEIKSQVNEVKQKWRTGDLEGAENLEDSATRDELEALKGVNVKGRFQPGQGEFHKSYDRSELDTSGAADARKSFLEGSAFAGREVSSAAAGEMSELKFTALDAYKDKFEKGPYAEDIQRARVELDLQLDELKQAFEKPESEMSPEERLAKKRAEIEAEFARYKLTRKLRAKQQQEEGGDETAAAGAQETFFPSYCTTVNCTTVHLYGGVLPEPLPPNHRMRAQPPPVYVKDAVTLTVHVYSSVYNTVYPHVLPLTEAPTTILCCVVVVFVLDVCPHTLCQNTFRAAPLMPFQCQCLPSSPTTASTSVCAGCPPIDRSISRRFRLLTIAPPPLFPLSMVDDGGGGAVVEANVLPMAYEEEGAHRNVAVRLDDVVYQHQHDDAETDAGDVAAADAAAAFVADIATYGNTSWSSGWTDQVVQQLLHTGADTARRTRSAATASRRHRRRLCSGDDAGEEEGEYDVKNLMNKFLNIDLTPKERASKLDELEALRVEAKNLTKKFEQPNLDSVEVSEDKRRQLEAEFQQLKEERQQARKEYEEEMAESAALGGEKEEIQVAADHASKMAAKWEKIHAKEAKKAEKSKMPAKSTT
uniref:Uncharacterized protein n=1 Tax=Globodera rostochiensis TaxID=31243 RepID=A0A914I985_GLORO